jgi:predicted RNA-binding protein YlxR (DUF448 family)
MAEERHIPIRMCVACRVRREARQMVRLRRGPEGVQITLKKKPPGRGFYLCRDERCFAVARKRKWIEPGLEMGGLLGSFVPRGLEETVGLV